jgi:hypothetical protein
MATKLKIEKGKMKFFMNFELLPILTDYAN